MKFKFIEYTKSRFLWINCLFIIFNAIDALSTAILMLKFGTQGEVNPIWRLIADVRGVDAFFFIKLVYPTFGLYLLHEYINCNVREIYFIQAAYGKFGGKWELFFRKWMIIVWHISFGLYIPIIGSHIVHWILIFCGVLK